MNRKLLTVTAVVLAVILFLALFLAFGHKKVDAPTINPTQTKSILPSPTPPNFTGNDDTLKNALNLYLEKKREGVDMSNGPCLGKIANDWVLDIAHNPRQAIDDKPQNQCADFQKGLVHHYIELDPNGNLIKSY